MSSSEPRSARSARLVPSSSLRRTGARRSDARNPRRDPGRPIPRARLVEIRQPVLRQRVAVKHHTDERATNDRDRQIDNTAIIAWQRGVGILAS